MKVDRSVLLVAWISSPVLLGALGQMIVGRHDRLLGRRILFYGTLGEMFVLVGVGLAIAGLGYLTVARRYWPGGLPGSFGARPRRELRGGWAVAVGISFLLLGLGFAAASGSMLYLLAVAGRKLEFL